MAITVQMGWPRCEWRSTAQRITSPFVCGRLVSQHHRGTLERGSRAARLAIEPRSATEQPPRCANDPARKRAQTAPRRVHAGATLA